VKGSKCPYFTLFEASSSVKYRIVRLSISRPATRDIEGCRRTEAGLIARQPTDQGRDFLEFPESPHGNLRQHEVDEILFHLGEERTAKHGGGDCIDPDAGGGEFLSQRLPERNPTLRIGPKAREFLVKEIEKFFFGERSEKSKEVVPRLNILQTSNAIRAADTARCLTAMSASE
jgi:hypothetical protein